MTPVITFEEGGQELLERVGPIWEHLRAHHEGITVHFKQRFASMNFPDRKIELISKGNPNGLHVIIIRDDGVGKDVGYAVSTINPLNVAEIDSLQVDDEYRCRKLGEELVKRSLAWIKEHKISNIIINVAVGNERALGFYRKFNFYPYTIQLLEKDV